MTISIRKSGPEDKEAIIRLLRSVWSSEHIVSCREIFDASSLPAFVAYDNHNVLIGLLTYRLIEPNTAHIISMNAQPQRQGTGKALIKKLCESLPASNVAKVIVSTSNDNLPAMEFYQKCGFRFYKIERDSITYARTHLKPQIPEYGLGGIPITDDIIFQLDLPQL